MVVRQRRHLGEPHLAGIRVDRDDRRLVDGDIRLVVEEVAQRMSDRALIEQISGNLIEQGLERVVVVLVDQHDLGIRLLQLARRTEPAESSPQDDHAFGHHGETVLLRAGVRIIPMG